MNGIWRRLFNGQDPELQVHESVENDEYLDPAQILEEVNTAYAHIQSHPVYGKLIAGIFVFGSVVKNDGANFRQKTETDLGSDLDIGLVYKAGATEADYDLYNQIGKELAKYLSPRVKELVEDDDRYFSVLGEIGHQYTQGIFATNSVKDVQVFSQDYTDDIKALFKQE